MPSRTRAISMRDIVTVIGRRLRVARDVAVRRELRRARPDLLARDQPASSTITRETLGWTPTTIRHCSPTSRTSNRDRTGKKRPDRGVGRRMTSPIDRIIAALQQEHYLL